MFKDTTSNEIKEGDVVIVPITPTYCTKSRTVLKIGIVKKIKADMIIVSYNEDSNNRTKSFRNGQSLYVMTTKGIPDAKTTNE